MTDSPDQSDSEPTRDDRRAHDLYQRQLSRSLERRPVNPHEDVLRLAERGRRQTGLREIIGFTFSHLGEALLLFSSRSYRQALHPDRHAPPSSRTRTSRTNNTNRTTKDADHGNH